MRPAEAVGIVARTSNGPQRWDWTLELTQAGRPALFAALRERALEPANRP